MKTCAVIPAAGLGTRLKINLPKILAPLAPTTTIWSLLRHNLVLVDHIHVIVSPHGEPVMRNILEEDLASGFVTMSIQPKPLGMGDAIFQGYPVWSQADRILVVWGDQACVSQDTFTRALKVHAGADKTIALPLARVATPYVEYLFNDSTLTAIRQSREQEKCAAQGLADVGTFVLSVRELFSNWNTYKKLTPPGSKTNEINFLPFLPYLASLGWIIHRVDVSNPLETRGINTTEDLQFFQQLFREPSS